MITTVAPDGARCVPRKKPPASRGHFDEPSVEGKKALVVMQVSEEVAPFWAVVTMVKVLFTVVVPSGTKAPLSICTPMRYFWLPKLGAETSAALTCTSTSEYEEPSEVVTV